MAPNVDEFNNDELEAPTWLDAEFIAKVLRNCESNPANLEVKNFKVSPATAKGDHYASVMFRVNVEYGLAGEDKSKSIIIKTMPEVEGHKKDFIGESYIFETEIGMYTEVLPRFEQILRDIGEETVLKAPCLYYELSPRKLIVFEDIVPMGYKVMRNQTPTSDEIKAVLVKLAKWHAISYKINIEEPHYFDEYRHSFLSMPNAADEPVLANGAKAFIAAYKSEPRLSKFIPYIEKLEPILLRKCIEEVVEYRVNPQSDGYYVLCHGDFHLKNMMFKHNEETGKLEDVMLLDFQFTYIGSIVLDLIYAIYMLLDDAMRPQAPVYLYFYMTQFNEILKKTGFTGPLPKVSRLHEQFLQHKHFELFIACSFVPFLNAVNDGKLDPALLMTSAEYRATFYNDERAIKELQRLLEYYECAGYFEDL